MKNTEFAEENDVIDNHIDADKVISIGEVVPKGNASSYDQFY
jgi:hypothetical protein